MGCNMATVPIDRISPESKSRVIRDGHCPELAEEVQKQQCAPTKPSYEQVLKIVQTKGW